MTGQINTVKVAYAKVTDFSAIPDVVGLFKSKTSHSFNTITDPESPFYGYLAMILEEQDFKPEEAKFNFFVHLGMFQQIKDLYKLNGFDIDPSSLYIGVVGGYNESDTQSAE